MALSHKRWVTLFHYFLLNILFYTKIIYPTIYIWNQLSNINNKTFCIYTNKQYICITSPDLIVSFIHTDIFLPSWQIWQ